MPDTDTDHSMTTSQTEREQVQVQVQEAEQCEETAPQAVRERWGQDPWEMRWGC
jgi:hypothetical protein